MSLFTRLVVGAADSPPARKIFTGTNAGRALARRFVAGESLDEAVPIARELNRSGLPVSLNLLGEEVAVVDDVDSAVEGYLDCLHRIAEERLDANISIKLTQLGLGLDRDLAQNSLHALAVAAADLGLTITIDMEDSRFTSDTVDVYSDAQTRHGNLGLALQAYLHRTPADVTRLAPLGGHLRLCKGAYVEDEEIAYTDRDDVRAAFARLLEVMMADDRMTPAIATHDPRLIELTKRYALNRRAPFEFQMLYGVRAGAQKDLARAGYPVRIFVPYGSRWYPYLVRRLGERPANLGFFLRALLGG